MVDINSLLDELGRRRMTNVLVEGGGRCSDPVSIWRDRRSPRLHVPKFIGGRDVPSPISGDGLKVISDALD